jgi:hypothetical protein
MTNPVCERRVDLLVCSLPLHRHSYIGFILAFASSIHNKQQYFQPLILANWAALEAFFFSLYSFWKARAEKVGRGRMETEKRRSRWSSCSVHGTCGCRRVAAQRLWEVHHHGKEEKYGAKGKWHDEVRWRIYWWLGLRLLWEALHLRPRRILRVSVQTALGSSRFSGEGGKACQDDEQCSVITWCWQ